MRVKPDTASWPVSCSTEEDEGYPINYHNARVLLYNACHLKVLSCFINVCCRGVISGAASALC
jgi:hypothetical protein